MYIDWSALAKSELYKTIISEWEDLLSNKNLKEKDYQSFLQSNPSFFFTSHDSYLVVSKLKLGSSYETDFVVIKEGYSDGTEYELIEIESPHTPLFDTSGKPSAKFNSALQQIRDWKRFLINNKTEFQRIFPTSSTKIIKDSKLSFKIVIGRRTHNLDDLEKRRQIQEQEKIEIVSFDRLTEIAKSKVFFPNEPMIYSAQMDNIEFTLKNQLANPFYKCINDSTWRAMCRKGHSHIYSNLIREILNNREYSHYYKEFITKNHD
ncbi:DUF4263 domain-containing protein [Riemerella anatipestifer]|nr:DUF4263 domain-containing protein [Riemerella anatipestifer]MDY3362466.1 DUF4263 domain-containing protein [Riemerella anatipestifer]